MSAFAQEFDYDHRTNREFQIQHMKVEPSTLDWIWDSSLMAWFRDEAKVFWVAGKPASGKSTLINYVRHHEKLHELVPKALGSNVAIAQFFFDYRGKEDDTNNLHGLSSSLLHQLLSASNVSEDDVRKHFHLGPQADLSAHSQRILEYVLAKDGRQFLLFLDGLDECQSQKLELVRLISEVVKFKVKICLASRNEPPFSGAYGDLAHKFYMHEVNKPGIESYARKMLESSFISTSNDNRRILDEAAEKISDASNGVFLWATFAVKRVHDKLHIQQCVITRAQIQNIITDMPPELEQVYSRIIDSIRPENRRECGIMLQLIDSAQTDQLSLSELLEAVLLNGIRLQFVGNPIRSKDLAAFERYVGFIGAGLVEVFSMKQSPIEKGLYTEGRSVRLIHRSIQTYLLDKGFDALLGKEVLPKLLWIKVCVSYLAGKGVKWVQPTGVSSQSQSREPSNLYPERPTRGPFAHTAAIIDQDANKRATQVHSVIYGLGGYVDRHMLYHVQDYEYREAKSCWSLIHTSLSATWIRQTAESHRKSVVAGVFPHAVSHILLPTDAHLAVLYHLDHYLEEALRHSPEVITSYSGTFTGALITNTQAAKEPLGGQLQSPPNASLHALAVLCSGTEGRWNRQEKEVRQEIVCSLATKSPRLHDPDMLMAFGSLSKREIQALLTRYPEGPLSLWSTWECHDMAAFTLEFGPCRKFPSAREFGPLWAVGGRSCWGGEVDGTNAVLDLLLKRGEDIKAPCGPYGTILHSVITHYFSMNINTALYLSRLRLFVRREAEINADGKRGEGNVLDYAWKMMHSSLSMPVQFGFGGNGGQLVELLITMGAESSTSDPNDLVPSREQLLAVAAKGQPNAEDMSIYHYGTAERCDEWQTDGWGRWKWVTPRQSNKDDDALAFPCTPPYEA